MRTKILTIALAVLLFGACKNQPKEKETPKATTNKELHLNKGEKWIANPETHIGMANLQTLLNTVPDTINYDTLVAQMQNETRFIINNCNMEGDDHEQLHLVLHPILDGIDKVKDSEETADKEKGITQIKTNLEDYFEYFKSSAEIK